MAKRRSQDVRNDYAHPETFAGQCKSFLLPAIFIFFTIQAVYRRSGAPLLPFMTFLRAISYDLRDEDFEF